MTVNVAVSYDGQKHMFPLKEGTPVTNFLKEKGLLHQTCGSMGKCGKCRIIANTDPTLEEVAMLNPSLLAQNIRLACYTTAREGLEIQLLEKTALTVLTTFSEQNYEFQPLVERIDIVTEGASIHDQRDDVTRLLEASNCKDHKLGFNELGVMSHKMHEENALSILKYKNSVIGLANKDHHLAMSVDIGTTTIATTLIDLQTGAVLAVMGEANAQASWGADVLSRINQTIPETTPDYEKNIKALQSAVAGQIEKLCNKLLQNANLYPEVTDVQYITITGNTTMMHLLCGLPAKNIGRAPFIPVTMEARRVKANKIGIKSKAHVFLMPSISSYIGADIVAALLAVNAHSAEKPYLLLDLGTNAEIVLGYKDKIFACSAAAGPCFEGANISCGLAGQSGAISDVILSEDKKSFEYVTINDKPACGICGSGVVDTLAMLLDAEAVDETGMFDADSGSLENCLFEDDNGQAYVKFTESISFTQKDIRSVQLAKSAVRAGIHILLDEAGISFDDIDSLYIAGGFGSAMNAKNAGRIGLIPAELVHCTKAIGNAASLGVIRYATEKNVDAHVKTIIDRTTYLELSAYPAFSNYYMEHMVF